MRASDSSGGSKPAGEPETALTGVDRLFGRDLRGQGWVLKLAPVIEPRQAGQPKLETASDTDPDPAMIWALGWRRK
jgi:hypothetical protein